MKRLLLLSTLVLIVALLATVAWFASSGTAPRRADQALSPQTEPVAPSVSDGASPTTGRTLGPDEARSAQPVHSEPRDDTARREAASIDAPASIQTLSGRVMSPSAPLAGAEVTLTRPDGSEIARARTDPSGQFFLALDDAVENGVLVAQAKGFAPTLRIGERVQRGERRNLGMLRLEPGVEVAGRVVDAAGRGVAGALVRLRGPALVGLANRPLAETVADAQGRFVLRDVPFGQVRIEANAAGHGGRALDPVDAPARELVLALAPEYVFRARIFDRRSGAPVAGARVELAALDRLAPPGAGTSGSDGALAIAGLGSALFAGKIQAPGYRVRSEARIEIGADELRYELDPWPCLRGSVSAARGETPSAIEIHLRATDAAGAVVDARPRASGRCEPDGSFVLCDLRPGVYVLEASAPGWAPRRSQPFPVQLDADPQPQRLVLDEGSRVHATVRALRGTLVDARIEMYRSPPAEAGLLAATTGRADGPASPIAFASADTNGRAVLEHLPDGAIWIVARARDHVAELRGPLQLDAREAPATMEFDLAPAARVRGRVLRGETPQPGALVILRRTDGAGTGAVQVAADGDGRYESPALPAGIWKLIARGAAGASGLRSEEVSRVLEGGQTLELDIEVR